MVKIRKLKKVRGITKLKKQDVGLCKNCQIDKMGKTSFKRKKLSVKRCLGNCAYSLMLTYWNRKL